MPIRWLCADIAAIPARHPLAKRMGHNRWLSRPLSQMDFIFTRAGVQPVPRCACFTSCCRRPWSPSLPWDPLISANSTCINSIDGASSGLPSIFDSAEFLCRQFVYGIPRELYDAVFLIDGSPRLYGNLPHTSHFTLLIKPLLTAWPCVPRNFNLPEAEVSLNDGKDS